MSFADDLRRFVLRTQVRRQTTYVGLATRVHRSIVGDGTPDPVTTAPGQPVDTGFLRDSFTLAIGPSEATIQTNVAYAPPIEDGVSAGGTPITFKSAVGGAHSVKLTIAGASALQADVVRELGP
jgi:hypothetical protein